METQQSSEDIGILFLIFMIIGGLILLISYWLYNRRQKLIQLGYRVTGEVIDVVKKSTGETVLEHIYAPVIQFRTHMNEVIIKTYPMGTHSSVLKKGDEVEIYYHPVKPDRFVMKEDKAMRFLFIVLGIIGAAFFLFGLIGMFFLK